MAKKKSVLAVTLFLNEEQNAAFNRMFEAYKPRIEPGYRTKAGFLREIVLSLFCEMHGEQWPASTFRAGGPRPSKKSKTGNSAGE